MDFAVPWMWYGKSPGRLTPDIGRPREEEEEEEGEGEGEEGEGEEEEEEEEEEGERGVLVVCQSWAI